MKSVTPIIKSSSDLRKNYNSIADIARQANEPVFLTKNGEGDTVLMDLKTYHRRERNLEAAERLIAAERARLDGMGSYSIEDFEIGMKDAIRQGARKAAIHGA